jgi:uncharacterized RDD family membrane protein YckC
MKCQYCQKDIVSDSYFCTWCDHFIPAPEHGEKAGLFARFVAASIDPLLGLISYVLAVSVFAGISKDLGATTAVLFPFIYFIWFLTLLRRGQTPGKLLLGLQVVGHRRGEIPGFLRMFLRELVGKFISGLFFGIGYFWAIFDRNGQAWHDKLVGTVVLKVRGFERASNPTPSDELSEYMELPPAYKPATRRAKPHPAKPSVAYREFHPGGSVAIPKPELGDMGVSLDKVSHVLHSAVQVGKEKIASLGISAAGRPNWPVAISVLATALVVMLGYSLYATKQEAARLRLQSENQASFAQLESERHEAERDAQTAVGTPRPFPSGGSTGAVGEVASPAIHVGDRYTYETVDSADSRVNNITTREIIGISQGVVMQRSVNTKSGYTRLIRYDTNWNVMSSGTPSGDESVFSPPLKYFDFPLAVGKTWEAHAMETNPKTGQTRSHTLRARVEAQETITVPAGTFDTLKIVSGTEAVGADKHLTGTDTSWYAPSVRRTVRSELVTFGGDSGGSSTRVVQLLNYELR